MTVVAEKLDDSVITAFAQNLRGKVLQSGHDEYDSARTVWNGTTDRRPALIVRCVGPSDVISCVNFARENGLLVAVRGGGHSASGQSVCDDGLVIDLSQMRSVRVDPAAMTVRAEAGATWTDFDAETTAFGLAVTGGQIGHTGIAGLTLGGGLGWLMRKCGLVIDNLLSVDLVTADGRLLHVSENENADLFWGVRGGGGNFGVVTSFEYRLHRLGPIVTGGIAFFPIERGREIFEFYRDLTKNMPDDMSAMVLFMTAPPAPFVPPDLQFKRVVALAVCHCGSLEEGGEAVAPIHALGPALDLIGPIPYKVLQSLIDEAAAFGRRNYLKSGFLTEIDDGVIDAFVADSAAPSPFSLAFLISMGGQASRVDPASTAFAHREAQFDMNIFSTWTDPAADEENIAWARKLFAGLRPFLHGVYVNSVLDDGTERMREVYPEETLARLTKLKNEYDPTNLFRLNQNVAPKG